MTTVMLVDDHPLVRLGMAGVVSRQAGYTIAAEAADGAAAIDLYRRVRPDVVLMDLMMPGVGGLEALQAIRAADPEARVVIVSSADGEEHVYRCLQAGARAYLLKDAPEAQVADCLHAVAAGRRYVPPEVAARLASRLDNDALTGRELDVLRFLAQGLSNKLIARAAGIAPGTVKYHVKNIMAKLDASCRTEVLREAVRRGIVSLAH
ncbi:LuxR family two component transcriptional regulator [Pseudoduganella flava]|uniref:LuxR family two component transcriptional regulator n=1 Tax=Pseudoduganella flava TaxID=871742 RepID=A0A562P9T0_9BURK|nr:response regulator transcription factor [Pseudoduganella flava]QGZ38043.1 response regulator [Pseudoduganella flava]TWI40980.1 LuxR family two component transcriptional regulator [Pseudoduganella flava]